MKKTVKILSLFAISLGLLASATSYASTLQGGYSQDLKGYGQWFFDQTSATTPLSQAQCSAAWVNKNYYLAGDANNDGVKDDGRASYLRDNFIMRGGTIPLYLLTVRNNSSIGTQVRYYTPESNMLSILNGSSTIPLTSKNAWYRLSSVAPKDQWVRAVESEPVLYSVPQSGNPANNTFQVAYDIMYKGFISKGTNKSSYSVWPLSDGNDSRGLFQNTDKWSMNANWLVLPRWQADYTKTASNIETSSINWDATESSHGYECFNVKVSRCGDGVLDNRTFDNGATAGEQCDLGTQNGKPGSECSATCTFVPKPAIPDVAIVKSVEGKVNGYLTGDTITYKLIVRNIGTGNATNVVVSDQLPAGVSYVAGSTKFANGTAVQPTYNATANTLQWNMGNMAAGYYNEITFQVKLNEAPFCAPFKNDATIEPDAKDGEVNKDNNYSTATFYTSCDNPDVITTKKADKTTYMPGDTVKYTLTYKNIGAGVANGVVVTDTLPAEVTYIVNSATSTPNIGQPTVNGNKLTWNIGTLAANAEGTITIQVKVAANAPVCTDVRINNNFTISATNEPSTLLGNNPSDAYILMGCVDLWATKEVDKGTVSSGDIVTYTINYGNSGTVAWQGKVVDTLPAKTEYVLNSASSNPAVGQPTVNGKVLTWDVGMLQPGAKGTITIKAKILGPVTKGEVILNKVCIEDDNNYNNNNCDDATSRGEYNYYDLSIDKTPKHRQVELGDEFDYTLKVSNNGTVGVTNFTVKDYLPKGLEYVSSSNNGTYDAATKTITWKGLSIGAVGSFNLTVKVKYIGPKSNGKETNWTEICDYTGVGSTGEPKDIDSNPCNGTGNNEDDVSSGSIIPTDVKYYDLSIDKTPKYRQVELGDEFDYTLKVSNSGTVGVTNFTVKDYLPKGLEYVSSSNNGTYDAATKTITWKGLSIGAVGSFNLTVKVKYIGPKSNGKETNWTEICDYTGVSSTGEPKDIDSNPCNGTGNNEDDVSSGSIVPTPDLPKTFDLSIDKLANGKKSVQVKSGDIVDFSLVVRNAGPATATNFTVKDYLPAGFIFVQASSNGKYVSNTAGNAGPGTLTWTGITLTAGGTTTLTFKAQYVDAVTRTNYTEICDYNGLGNGNGQDGTKPHDIDSNPCNGTGNNEDDTSNATVNPANNYFDLDLKKYFNGNQKTLPNVRKDTLIDVTLVVTNSGTVGVNGFSVKDYMPVGLEYAGQGTVSGSLTPATFSDGEYNNRTYPDYNRTVTISNLSLPAKGSLTITFKAKYTATVARTNYAEVCDYNGKTATNDNPKDIDSDPCNNGPTPEKEDDASAAQITPSNPPNPPIGGPVCGDGRLGGGEMCDMGPNGGTIPSGAGYPADAVGKWCYGNTPAQQKLGIACTYNKPSTPTSYCGDGKRDKNEVCDMGPNGGIIPLKDANGKDMPNGGRYCYGANSQYACNIKAPEVEAPTCAYIDPPSIQTNEYLPFRWNIESKLGADIENNLVAECTATSTGKILKSSLECEFEVKDTEGLLTGFTQKCFDTSSNEALLKSAFSKTLAGMGYTPEEFPTPAGLDLKKFNYRRLGEHTIDVRVKEFQRCGDTTTTQTSANERVCQMNYAVTKPYMVSRGVQGDFATSPLTDFYTFPDGNQVYQNPGIPALTASYAVTDTVRSSVNKLVEDYRKIAVKADSATFVVGGTTVQVYKVPNREVYIFSPDSENATITVGDKGVSEKDNKPFTLILTQGHLVVKGNLQNKSRGMYITQKGNIKFSMNSCNVQQEVNGIFISLNDIKSDAGMGNRVSAHNTDPGYGEWCIGGSLKVKGVLIGDRIGDITSKDSLLNTRRSDANQWFNGNSNKQEYLKNYAAVVLQYNPDIFTNLPPGADTLSQILNVQKK